MPREVSVLLLLIGLLGLPALLPGFWAGRHGRGLGRLVTALTAVQLAVALALLVANALELLGPDGLLALGVISFQYDRLSGLMFLLISFIGWVTCQYSIRYLDGEVGQGRYFQWMSFTIGAVGAMVLSADLLTFGLFWCLTSFGLHHLLTHYSDRPAAQRAAWTKFIVSRIGDGCVLVAICCYYQLIQSLRFTDLVAAATDATISSQPVFQFGTLALALGVLAKSAQLPFHTWLPLTMETPTPVSALMHAGIVNAGGYLLVRASPLLSGSTAAQSLLVVVGTITACVASVIMLTQTSIKKKLAYSTIAQMGFMLMQCGLGAYTAAMLHILAHSLYKAHEFLSSGSVMARRAATQTAPIAPQPVPLFVILLTMAGLTTVAWGMLLAVGQDPSNKPGGWLLTAILCAALTTWLAQTMAVARRRLVVQAWLMAPALIATYAISFSLIDSLVLRSATSATPAWPVLLVVAVAFAGLFAFQIALMSPWAAYQLRNWQIHATNGFYIESWLRRNLRALKY